jgi:hypothetical protein
MPAQSAHGRSPVNVARRTEEAGVEGASLPEPAQPASAPMASSVAAIRMTAKCVRTRHVA